jgi:hypothetical protein
MLPLEFLLPPMESLVSYAAQAPIPAADLWMTFVNRLMIQPSSVFVPFYRTRRQIKAMLVRVSRRKSTLIGTNVSGEAP